MVLITFSANAEFKERFQRLVYKGQRSHFILMSVDAELDKLEDRVIVKIKQEGWLEEMVIPELSKYLHGKTNYQILEFYDEDKLESIIERISKKTGTTISKEHMRLCLMKVSNDRQQNG